MENTFHSFQASKSPMRRAWKNDAMWLDLLLAAVIFLVGETAAQRDWLSFGTKLDAIKGSLYTTEAAVCAAILGFLIAGAAVLVASSNLERLKTSSFQLYKLLARSFRNSMYCSILTIAFVIGALIFDQDKSTPVAAVVAVVLLMLVLGRVLRAARRLYLTLLI